MENINIENQLIIKYLTKTLSEEESMHVVSWLQQDKAHQDFLFKLEELYWANQMKKMQRLADTNHEWKKLESYILQNKTKKFLFRKELKYVAIIVVLISMAFIVSKMDFFDFYGKKDSITYTTVITKKGERTQIILPDSSKVWLNSCTSIVYNNNSKTDRQIKLSGEAYFEIKKDTRHPFIVSTSLIDIEVLGTQFNLRAFDDEDLVQTSLYEGQVIARTVVPASKQEVFLKPGERLTYKKNKTWTLATDHLKDDRYWKEGAICFRQQTLQNIARILERTFDVEITIVDENLLKEKFTGEFKNGENVNDILKILKMTKKLDYLITDSKIKIISPKI
jgi:ferric-dicitrate binding protein FerR (iron transport regulator)